MSYFDTFVKSSKNPKEKWKDGLQELVNKSFENASTYQTDVEVEIGFGILEFEPIICRVTTIIDAKTGQRVNDDYKKLIFPDLDYLPKLGTRYRFENNIWLVINTDDIKTDTAAVYVRRCNNTMNFQDKYGNIHKEPCYIDYKVTENQLFREYSMDVASGRIMIQCQKNSWTTPIDINDRFVFGDDLYKIRNRARFDRTETFDNDSNTMVTYYADYDNEANYDNVYLGVADYKEYNYRIETIDQITNMFDFSGKIDWAVYCNDDLVDEPVFWESTDPNIAKIDPYTGVFEFLSVGNCSFIVTMINKQDVKKSIEIEVVTSMKILPEVVIEPNNIVKIPINNSVKYTVYEYINGDKTDSTFNILTSGLGTEYYHIETDGDESTGSNVFIITSMKPNRTNLLKVTCVNRVPRENEQGQIAYKAKEILIEMGGIK